MLIYGVYTCESVIYSHYGISKEKKEHKAFTWKRYTNTWKNKLVNKRNNCTSSKTKEYNEEGV